MPEKINVEIMKPKFSFQVCCKLYKLQLHDRTPYIDVSFQNISPTIRKKLEKEGFDRNDP